MPETITFNGRQRDIVRLAAANQGPKEMANTLGISVRTVTVHLQSIYTRLQFRGAGCIVRLQDWARANGYGQNGAPRA